MIGKTAHSLSVIWLGYRVTIPAGAECRKDWAASGTNKWFLTTKGTGSCQVNCQNIFNHDRCYRYLFLPDHVEVTLS